MSALQSGQLWFRTNQRSPHSAWNTCPHFGRIRRISLDSYCAKQMLHISSVSSPSAPASCPSGARPTMSWITSSLLCRISACRLPLLVVIALYPFFRASFRYATSSLRGICSRSLRDLYSIRGRFLILAAMAAALFRFRLVWGCPFPPQF